MMFKRTLCPFLFRHKVAIIALFLIGCLYLVLRLFELQLLPYFVDEAIYARWAQMGKYDPSLRFISLVDGKQPLYIWLITLAMHFIPNPFIAGRIISILAGLGTMTGLFLLSKRLFASIAVGVVTVFLYVIYPFALHVNRMAIFESLVGFFSVWILYIGILLVQTRQWGISFILGLFLGGSLLTKSTSMITIYLLPTTVFLFPFKKKKVVSSLGWIMWVFAIALGLAFLCSSVLYLSDKQYMIAEKEYVFRYHFSELIPYHAFQKWGGNILTLLRWVAIYLTYPLFFLSLLPVFFKKKRREIVLLLLWFFIPIVGIGLFGRVLYPRYVFPASLFLLPLLGYGLVHIFARLKNKLLACSLFVLVMLFALYSDVMILTHISHAPLPEETIQQDINGLSSGEGLRPIVKFLQVEAMNRPLVIATEGTYGSLPTTVIDVFFINNTQTERISFAAKPKRVAQSLLEKSRTKPVYVIFNETQNVRDWPLDLVMKFKRGSGDIYTSLYRIHPLEDSVVK